jgi:L-fuconolactonase
VISFRLDLQPLLEANGFDGCVAVQADQSEQETRFLLDHAASHGFIKGVVGWVDLRAHDLEVRLEKWSDEKKLKGFRHILQAEKPDFMLESSFLRGLGLLGKTGYTYDILVYPNHLSAVCKMLELTENQSFVVDHIAKPYIKSGLIDEWERDIRKVAKFPNVYCKVSGLVTESQSVGLEAGRYISLSGSGAECLRTGEADVRFRLAGLSARSQLRAATGSS